MIGTLERLPDGTDHTTGFGQGAVIRQESVPGVNWPGDGMIIKYLGADSGELRSGRAVISTARELSCSFRRSS